MSAMDQGHGGPRPDSASGGRRPAGAPNEERRAAGLPEEEQRPAGTPANQPRAARSDEGRSAGAPADEPRAARSDERGARSDSAEEVEHDLDALLADVQRERDEYLEIAKRARADFENYRKRSAREAQEAERRGKAGLARELVPALDNLERALRVAGVDPETGRPASGHPGNGGEEADSAPRVGEVREAAGGGDVARGVALVYRELRDALARTGVETYDPTGEKFDPTTSEALATREGGDQVDAGIVLETVERGYRLDGQVLRAARVVVSE
jgi:molecular chaperone GrpE